MPDLFSANGNVLKVDTTAEYDPGITPEIDKAIRHMHGVVAHCASKAVEVQHATGSDHFVVITQNDPETQRPRVYVAPRDDQGIHEELADAVLLKAALGMTGK